MPSVPSFTVSYAKVEAALVKMHNIASDDVSAFRARFGALQRGGLLGPESQPGKGRRLEYGPDQMHRAVLAFELVQAGVAPGIILPLIRDYWNNKLSEICLKADRAIEDESRDVVLILAGVTALSSNTPVPNINHTTLDKMSERMTLALDGKGAPARALLVNLSAQLRKFHDALVGYHLQAEPRVEAMTRGKSKRQSTVRKR